MEKVRQVLIEFFGPSVLFECEDLSGGSTEARNLKVAIDKESYVLRMLDPTVDPEKWKQEIFAQKLASHHKIAPQIYHVSSDYSSVLMEYMEGKTLQLFEVDSSDTILAIAFSVRTLHGIPAEFLSKECVLEEMERKYLLCKQKCRGKSFPLLDTAIDYFRKLEKATFRSQSLVFCHGDLNPTNLFLSNGRAVFIDFGDAALCEPFFDLAISAVLNAMDAEQSNLLLSSYLEKEPSERQKSEFFLMQQAVRIGFALNLLVYLVEDLDVMLLKKLAKRPLLVFLREEEALFGNKLRSEQEFIYDMAISSLVELMQEASLELPE